MIWKEKTCENCVFRVGFLCRRFPPNDYEPNKEVSYYPAIQDAAGEFNNACSEWKES